MSKAKEISVELVAPVSAPAQLSDQDAADQIIALHTNSGRAAYQQIGYAFLTGQALNRRKELLPFGQWVKWCQRHLEPRGLKERTARNYMAFAEALQPRLLQAPAASGIVLQLTNGESLGAEQIATFSEAIREVANGQSLTDLYRDYGIVKDKQEKKFSPPKITPEEVERSKTEGAISDCRRLIELLDTWHLDHEARARIDIKLRNALVEACVRVSSQERATINSQKGQSQKESRLRKQASRAQIARAKKGAGK